MKKIMSYIILGRKKIAIGLMCIIIFCFFVGCNDAQEDRYSSLGEKANSEDERVDSMMNQVLVALNANDEELLESLFSEGVKEEVSDLNESIKEVVEFYQGTGEITKSTHMSYTHNERGKKIIYLEAYYTVSTEDEIYRINIVLQDENDFNESMEGLYLLQIATEQVYEKEEFVWEDKNSDPGIYIQNDRADEYEEPADMLEKEKK